MRGQMTHRDFKNFDIREDGPAAVDRPGLKRKDSSPEKTDGKKKTKEENSKSTTDHKEEDNQPDKARREKVYNTFDYIRLNESYKRNHLKEKDPEEKDSESKETTDEQEAKDKTNSERPKIELKFKKQMR